MAFVTTFFQIYNEKRSMQARIKEQVSYHHTHLYNCLNTYFSQEKGQICNNSNMYEGDELKCVYIFGLVKSAIISISIILVQTKQVSFCGGKSLLVK